MEMYFMDVHEKNESLRLFFVFCFVAVVLFQTISACDDNQYPNECGTACPVNCQNRHSPPSFCTQQCVNRCDCKKGACDDNQFNNGCGTACPVNCQNRSNPPRFCTQQCIMRWDCKEGCIFKSGKSGK
ncbi:hypothetical protein HNY73_021476 [Argiope bruennichi]|uniref:TIL domain-containing protein n=1 Tax=Argiope bruennichi TaxID=94029 RepID=A0A8T0DZQ3_ARGBR|nr:hypothetical protein HNY73_021476 [Argiope bruennichi]